MEDTLRSLEELKLRENLKPLTLSQQRRVALMNGESIREEEEPKERIKEEDLIKMMYSN